MKNKTVKMIFAVAVLAVCCGAYVGVKTYVAQQEKQEESEEDAAATEVFAASTDDISAVKFIIDKKEVTFKKDEEDLWIKEGETEFPVNQTTLNEAVSSISSVESDRVIDVDEVDDLSEYGLDNPANTVTVTAGDDTTTLRIGDLNDTTNQYYVNKDDDRETVYLVDAACITPFMNELYDYAEGESFPVITAENVNKVTVDGEDNDYILEKEDETGYWNITEDGNSEKADSAKASTLTSALGSVAYDKFVDYNCEDKSIYGLDKPYAEITVDYEEETAEDEAESDTDDENTDTTDETSTEEAETVEKQIVITVGDESEDGSRYVMLNDNNQVYTISDDTLTAFIGKTSEDFWDLTVSYLPLNDLETITVETSNEKKTINVSRETSENEDGEEESTTSYLMDGEEADSTAFTTFYNKLITMVGQRRLTDPFESKNAPEMTVTFEPTDTDKIEVSYYAYDTNYYAAVVDDKVYLVNKMTVKELFEAYDSLIGEKTESQSTETDNE